MAPVGQTSRHNRQLELRQQLPYQVFQFLYALLGHIVLQAGDEVVDNAVAELHHGRANLYVAAAKLDEFQSVSPGLNAAHARVRGILQHRGFYHGQDVAKGNGLDGLAGQSGTGLGSVYLRPLPLSPAVRYKQCKLRTQ